MNKHQITLAGFRSRDLDGNDPEFAAALRALEIDPELAAWFKAEQEFDAAMRAKLQQVSVPAGLKNDILQNQKISPAKKPLAWRSLAAAAAIAVAGFLAWRMLPSRTAADSLAMRAIDYSETMPPLQMVCFDANAVAAWVNEQPSLKNANFIRVHGTSSMHLMGASAIEWEGKPVALLCLQNDRRMAMVYLFRGSDFKVPTESPRVFRHGDWISKTGRVGQNDYVLTTRGGANDLDFEMPF
jgi:hypothetical protein